MSLLCECQFIVYNHSYVYYKHQTVNKIYKNIKDLITSKSLIKLIGLTLSQFQFNKKVSFTSSNYKLLNVWALKKCSF